MIADNLILVDVDGVLLNWEYAFTVWMIEHGYNPVKKCEYDISIKFDLKSNESAFNFVKTFNESSSIGFLPPMRDAIHYVQKLNREHGFKFVIISAMSDNLNAKKLRIQNLEKLFGADLFEEFIFVDYLHSKVSSLSKWKNTGCWWLEDNVAAAEAGKELGLESVLMEHGYNMNDSTKIPFVKNWKDFYRIVVGE